MISSFFHYNDFLGWAESYTTYHFHGFEFSQDKQRYYVITNHYLSLSFCKRIYIRIYSFILNAKIYFEVFTSKGKSFKIEYI